MTRWRARDIKSQRRHPPTGLKHAVVYMTNAPERRVRGELQPADYLGGDG